MKTKFYTTGGSLQYFYGDIETIKRNLRKKGIKTRIVKNRRGDGWIVMVSKKGTYIHLNDYR